MIFDDLMHVWRLNFRWNEWHEVSLWSCSIAINSWVYSQWGGVGETVAIPAKVVTGPLGVVRPSGLSRDRIRRNRCRSRKVWTLSPQVHSLDPRLSDIPSLLRTAAWDGGCDGVESTCTLSAPGPADAGPHLEHRAVSVRRYWGRMLLFVSQVDTAWYEGRTQLGVSAGSSRIRFPWQSIRAVYQKPMRYFPSIDLAEVRAKLASLPDRLDSARSLTEKFGAGLGIVSTEAEHIEVLIGDGSGGKESSARTSHAPRTTHSTHRSSENSNSQRRTLTAFSRTSSLLPNVHLVIPPKFQLSSSDAGQRPHWRRRRSSWRCQLDGGTSQDESENRSSNHHNDNLREQARTVVNHAVQAEKLGQRGRDQSPKMTRQTETGSRSSRCWPSSSSKRRFPSIQSGSLL